MKQMITLHLQSVTRERWMLVPSSFSFSHETVPPSFGISITPSLELLWKRPTDVLRGVPPKWFKNRSSWQWKGIISGGRGEICFGHAVFQVAFEIWRRKWLVLYFWHLEQSSELVLMNSEPPPKCPAIFTKLHAGGFYSCRGLGGRLFRGECRFKDIWVL